MMIIGMILGAWKWESEGGLGLRTATNTKDQTLEWCYEENIYPLLDISHMSCLQRFMPECKMFRNFRFLAGSAKV